MATVDSSTGVPTGYAIKAFGRVISGQIKTKASPQDPLKDLKNINTR